MLNKRWLKAVVIIAACLLICSCSGKGDPVGTTPGPGSINQELIQGQTGFCPAPGHIMLGLFNCTIDTRTGVAEAVPIHTADLTLNVTNLLNKNPGSFAVTDVDITDFPTEGKLACNIRLTHPFVGLDEYDTFDWWGVFLHNGASSLYYDGLTYSGGPDAGENEAVLLNPDGYTRWFNQPEFDGDGLPILEYYPSNFSNLPEPTATLNPYKVYADNLGNDENFVYWAKDPDKVEDRGIFRAGVTNSRHYEIQFPMSGGSPLLYFQFAVIANWAQGDPTLTGLPTYYDTGDFPPDANVEEPFLVTVSTAASDLYYVNESTYGGDFKAELEVFDWQGGIAGGNGVPNEIHSVVIEGDFLPTGMDSYEFSQAELATVATGGSENSSVFQVEITSCAPEYNAEADFWVIVEAAGLKGDTYYQGFDVAYPEDARRASFMRGTVLINSENPNTPPIITGIHDDTLEDPYKNPVDVGDTAVTYTVDYIDPDPGDIHTITWWIVEEGNTPAPSDEVTMPVDWSVYSAGDYEIYVEVDDGTDSDTESYPITLISQVTYNLVLSIERNLNDLITGIILDWDDTSWLTGYNIYRQDPFDPDDVWVLIPDCPVAASEYIDHDIVGNEGYQYRVVGLNGADEVAETSVEAYALLENAEDNVNTDSPWDHCTNAMYWPGLEFEEFAPFNQTPHNGTYCWDEGGEQHQGYSTPGGYNTSTATLFSTPILPIPDGADTCQVEFMVRLNNLPDTSFKQCGTEVGVTNSMADGSSNPFIPSQDCINGLAYNLQHVEGFTDYGTFPNINDSNNSGHGLQYPDNSNVQYVFSKYSVPDVFTIPDARVAFAFACANSAGGTAHPNPGTSFDDIAVLVY